MLHQWGIQASLMLRERVHGAWRRPVPTSPPLSRSGSPVLTLVMLLLSSLEPHTTTAACSSSAPFFNSAALPTAAAFTPSQHPAVLSTHPSRHSGYSSTSRLARRRPREWVGRGSDSASLGSAPRSRRGLVMMANPENTQQFRDRELELMFYDEAEVLYMLLQHNNVEDMYCMFFCCGADCAVLCCDCTVVLALACCLGKLLH